MDEQNPLVSIIVTCFNSEKYLSQLLPSIQNQSYSNWECIFVDDGSKDNTVKILQDHAKADSRYRIAQKKPEGLCSLARNFGIKIARGYLIAILDHDDLWHLDKLRLQVEAMVKNKNGDLCVTKHVDFTCEKAPDLNRNHSNIKICLRNILPQLLKNNIYCVSSFMIRRKSLQICNIFSADPKLVACEDFYLLISYASKSSIIEVDAPLTFYRNLPNSMSRDSMRMVNGLYHTALLLKESNASRHIISAVEAQAQKSHAVAYLWKEPRKALRLAIKSLTKKPRLKTFTILLIAIMETLLPKSTGWIQNKVEG